METQLINQLHKACYSFVVMFFLIGCDSKKEILYSKKMTEKTISICEKNGGIDFIKVSNEDNYFKCKKQGFLRIDKLGNLENPKSKETKTFLLEADFVKNCLVKCNDFEIVRFNSRILCECP